MAVHIAASHEHMTGNESLKDAMKNMTLLNVNKTELQQIIKEVHSDNIGAPASAKVLNPHPFKYILNTPTLCREKDIFILAYIHTGVGNYKRRMVIRQTWGNMKYYPNINFRLVFVMGIAPDKPELQQVSFIRSTV